MSNQEKNDASDNEDGCLSDEEGTIVDGIYIPPPTKPTLSFDPTGPRLIITKIVNFFFKSYANEIILGPFHKCFNAIVGPNGSGKSNVIDSMLFVFGYRATKIRSKKLSVLLHNSEHYRNVQSCTVSVHFALIRDKEGDDYEVVPHSEFVVSRTANKDNTSFYELNKKRVQFKEVGRLLKKHGIDLDHNRFLILQGEVEQIAMMKCKADNDHETGILEYLEDIIGTSRYKKPLEMLEERVENLSEQRTEKLNRVKIVEKELDTLREPMEEAMAFLKTENTVVRCKNFLYQKNVFDLQQKINDVETESQEVKEIQRGFVERLEALSEKKKEIDKTYNKEQAVCDNLRKRKEGLKEAFDKANKRDMQLQEDMINKNKTRKKTKELIALEKQKLENLEKVPVQSKEGIEECEKKIGEMSTKKEKLEEEKSNLLKTIQKETEGLQKQKSEMQKDLAVLKEAVDKTKSAFNIAETELKMYVSSEESERLKFDNLKNLIQSNESIVKERTQQVAELRIKIPTSEKKLNEANKELCRIRLEESQLTTDARSKRLNLEEGRSSLQASNSRNKVLDSLMRAKREGKCAGLFGRLGDLGAIDQKYDVAISTCCGALDNIVVDTVDCAQWCIEFLKKYDVGRATFIALEKQEHLRNRADNPIHTPENVPRLYDLIRTPDDRVRPAFYYALGDTLVANDLDQASRIAYGAQRYRVVTLKGDVIETTGTMSGGGRTVMRGRMSSKAVACTIDPRELEKLEQEVNNIELRIREMRQKQVSLENEINTLTAELRPMKIDFEKYEKEMQILSQQLPQLKKQLLRQESVWKSKKADPHQVEKLTADIETKKIDFDDASETANALQVEVDKITKQIKDKSTGKISIVDKNIRETNKIIEKCKSEITRLKVAVKTAERNYKTSKENLVTMEQDVTNMENSLRAMKEERAEIEGDAAKLLTCIEEITEQLDERDEKLKEWHVKMSEISKGEKQLKSDKIDIDEKVKAFEKKTNDIKGALHGWNVKLKNLTLQELPEESQEELKNYTENDFKTEDSNKFQKDLEAAESHLKTAKPNLNAIQEYKTTRNVYMERSKDLELISNKREEMRQLFDKLRNQRKEEFITGYNIIRLKLKEMYQMITLGGDADFEMVDTYDPFTEGIQFNVRPPKKSWKKICNLSGGEKTLSSLALVFALHYYKPSPLYFMDEIDAALDFKNVSIVGHYIKERTKNAQFIIISLRLDMFELADNMIGIYKNDNCTNTITINPKVYVEEEEPAPIQNPTMNIRNIASNERINIENVQIEESEVRSMGLPPRKSVLSQIEPNGEELDETEIRASQGDDLNQGEPMQVES